MKIRTQFFILLFGIILIPLIVLGAAAAINYYRSPDRVSIPGVNNPKPEAKQKKRGFELHGEELTIIKNFVDRLPPSVEALIMDRTQRVLYSGFSEIAEGEKLNPVRILELFSSEEKLYFFQVDYNFGRFFADADIPQGRKEHFKNLVLISRVQQNIKPMPNRFEDVLRAAAVVFAALFIFCAIVIMSITRSVSRSVTLLEKATRNIAEGNLDTAIEVKGSNEITSLTHSLNTMRLALKDSQMRRSRFIMGVSHDLRTPLSLIKGYSEAIADDIAETPEMRKKSLEIIGDKIITLEEMIDDLINYVKLDSGEWRNSLEKRKLKSVLQNYANRLSADASLLGRVVEFQFDLSDDVLVPLDERLFIRMLENLCGNALRYTEKSGVVRIEAQFLPHANCGEVVLIISDNGCGISQEDIPFIFDPFFRGSNSRREDGKGLGLAVVKSIIDSHGWKITVDSQKNKGSSFTITMAVEEN